ncbi:MAG TPA: diacylglycerol kinase family protein [Steroidobacteraceae bacterium]|jgi:diacylglycerol kinase (ATP)|nr:diacylglycerol kinase family protein [Steroidobacteraceae bacterium]
MSSNAFRSFVILNPASAAGATGRRWDRIARLLRSSLGDFEHAVTQKPGEATTLARAALREGFEMVVSVGGDGTLNEVVGGFFEASVAVVPEAVLGVVALGTGCDFGRTIDQTDLESACARLGGHETRPIDVGVARFTGHDGATTSRIFINVASFGCGGLVSHLVSPRLKAVSGKLAFTLATLRALAVYRDQVVTLEFDDLPPRSIAITNCALGNGRFFGAGMQVAPAAQLDDGELDVTIWSGFRLMDFIQKRHTLYDGSHVREPGAQVLRCRRAIATSESTVLLELDGESVGRLPAQLEVLAGAVRLKV